MIEILLLTGSGSYLVIQDQTPGIFKGDPDRIVDDLNTGSVLKEDTDFLLLEDNNLIILE
jgi:hypothetical protein